MPEDSDNYEFIVENGDIIALASDGVLDNVYDSVMEKEIGILQSGITNPTLDELQVKHFHFGLTMGDGSQILPA